MFIKSLTIINIIIKNIFCLILLLKNNKLKKRIKINIYIILIISLF